jgi:hypothetical protein
MSSSSNNSEVAKDNSPTEVSPSKDDSYSEVSLNRDYRPPKILHPTLAFHADRWRNHKESTKTVLLPGHQCPSFNTVAVMEDGETTEAFSDSDFQATYVVLFFFPMDWTGPWTTAS